MNREKIPKKVPHILLQQDQNLRLVKSPWRFAIVFSRKSKGLILTTSLILPIHTEERDQDGYYTFLRRMITLYQQGQVSKA